MRNILVISVVLIIGTVIFTTVIADTRFALQDHLHPTRLKRDNHVAEDLKYTPCAPSDYFTIECNTCYCKTDSSGYLCTDNTCQSDSTIFARDNATFNATIDHHNVTIPKDSFIRPQNVTLKQNSTLRDYLNYSRAFNITSPALSKRLNVSVSTSRNPQDFEQFKKRNFSSIFEHHLLIGPYDDNNTLANTVLNQTTT